MPSHNVLVISPVATHPPYRGNRQRILQLAKLFSEDGFGVQLAIGRNRKVTPEAKNHWSVVHRLEHPPKWKPTSRNVPLDSWYRRGLGEEIREIVHENNIDVVLLNYVFHSRLLEFLPSKVFKIIDTHDVFTNRRELYVGYRYTGGFFSCTAEDEATYLNRADAIVSISPGDSKKFRNLVPNIPIIDIPFLAAGPSSTVKKSTSNQNPSLKTVGMVLSANDLNVASLHSFIAAVDDQYGRTPPFRVLVAGDIISKSIRMMPHRIPAFSRPWLKYVGQIPDLFGFYRGVDVIAVPVIAGSGMAIKFSEAILADAPVISTAQGSRGHEVTHYLHQLGNNWELAKHLGTIDRSLFVALRESEKLYQERAKAVVRSGWADLKRLAF